MKLIDLTPVRRCGECYHLIPAKMDKCPYCHGDVKAMPSAGAKIVDDSSSLDIQVKPLSPQAKKRLLIGGCCLAVLVVGVLIWQYIANSMVLGKSIFEPLDESTVVAKSKENPDFSTFYSEVSELREYVKSDEDKQKYGNITYNDFLSFYNSYSSPVYCEEIARTAKEKYMETKLAPMQSRIDSVKNYWTKYMESHDVNKLITVDIKTDVRDGYPIFYYIVRYPQEKLSNCSAELVFQDRWGYTNTHPQSLEDLLEHNSPDKALNFNWQDAYYWNNHEVTLKINSVTIEKTGETISAEDMENVPDAVMSYLNDASEHNLLPLIVETIDPEFPSEGKYVLDAIWEHFREKNPEIYELIERVERAAGRTIIQRGVDPLLPSLFPL